MMNHGIVNFKRCFSSGLKACKEWRLIESRRVARKPDYKVGDAKPHYIPAKKPDVPDYKYGESKIFKQSNTGLYGGSFIQHGNTISESKHKTRRTWLPNIVKKALWSETLNKKVSLKMTTKVLRTISKEGGLDNYLIKEKSARIKELGPTGWKLRYAVLKGIELKNNPIHKDAEVIERNGKKIKVFFSEDFNGKTLKITVGKRKLLQYLYPLEKFEKRPDGITLNFKTFMEDHKGNSVNEIISKLSAYKFDLSKVTV
ncbi:hypothetical protein Kpol_1060p22 [Vanderwaltozyma polyspora DSM 70294]|uniref:Large ribosomal subunit protein bL28m n=1 Tax=Vanderwaltozyma polyspora (strain ATCC 22028 / DSM 70294 / BCRC 21397 / CBS 2163 / NBRC 10782 / NRRL Y-8283 / UCD 57-17) TaxID=436907 RepID=A7TK20_VANPO|nr:uncharacterized protein Kpol_1060p22 [Vanderwaltozyma polyspora DSM 70294]EDO17366.1 hypothetical protein Kpol_1060p22 [Vanderwaltozyma polyspora DSM 70294]